MHSIKKHENLNNSIFIHGMIVCQSNNIKLTNTYYNKFKKGFESERKPFLSAATIVNIGYMHITLL